jgi:hypothetical protein
VVFDCPLQLDESSGYYWDSGPRLINLRHLEFHPLRPFTLAATEGLVTDRGGQDLAGLALPLYAARRLGNHPGGGGRGTYVATLEPTYRITRSVSVYGEAMLNEADVAAGTSLDRLGWLGGVHWTPPYALPGTSYRAELGIVPNTGSYTGLPALGLDWVRGGFPLGFPFGGDSWRLLLSGRQRLSSRFDLALSVEQYRQSRRSPVELRTSIFDANAGYDVASYLGFVAGYRHDAQSNLNGIQGNDQVENLIYLETRTGY